MLTPLVLVVLVTTGCSGTIEFSVGGQSVTGAAEELIESDAMFQRLNVEPITEATCVEPAVEEVGAVFDCTATSGGNEILFEVEIDSEDSIFAAPQNVLEASLLPAYTSGAIDALNSQNNFTLPTDSLDCGTKSVVLDADNKMYCLLNDPSNGNVFNVEITVRDLETAAFGVEIVSLVE